MLFCPQRSNCAKHLAKNEIEHSVRISVLLFIIIVMPDILNLYPGLFATGFLLWQGETNSRTAFDWKKNPSVCDSIKLYSAGTVNDCLFQYTL